MHWMVRAAGLAALALVLGFAALGWGDPLRAWQGAAAPRLTGWQDHETARAAPSDLGLNDAAPPPFVDAAPPAVDVAPPAPTLADRVAAKAGGRPDDAGQSCLASAVYFEARGESLEGQLAVAEVVLNRVRSGLFPATICGVVRQPAQFSFVRRGHIPRVDRDAPAWRRAVAIARIAQSGEAPRQVPADALWYHARSVHPGWCDRLDQTARIGLHVFYS
jgi:spore germination cell wall hydrolase CwlJ-like protein